jgi:hypothetical protein
MKSLFRTPFLLFLVLCLTIVITGRTRVKHAVFDFDGDGLSDPVLIETKDTAMIWHILQSKDGMYTVEFGRTDLNDIAVPADYNGDGYCDIAVWRPGMVSDLYRGQANFWIMYTNQKPVPAVIPWGIFGDNPRITQDFDGDGAADPAIVRRENGAMIWWIRYSSGGTAAVPYGLDTDYFVRGDYDGDGKADLAVYRTVTDKTVQAGTFIVTYSKSRQVMFTQFGSPDDVIVPGDYDGDGISDYAVFRNRVSKFDHSAYWYWQRSTDGKVEMMPFGLTLDMPDLRDCPAPGDYDMDGATDLGVWRMVTTEKVDSEFHMLKKKGGYQAFTFGTSYMEVPNVTMQMVDTKYPQ